PHMPFRSAGYRQPARRKDVPGSTKQKRGFAELREKPVDAAMPEGCPAAKVKHRVAVSVEHLTFPPRCFRVILTCMARAKPRHIIILTFADGLLLDAAGPLDAFHTADLLSAAPPGDLPGNLYRVHLASPPGGLIRMSNGVSLMTETLDAALIARADTLLVAGGPGARAAINDARLHRLLRHAAGKLRRIGSVCSGNFPLAGAGLLDGKRATGHWRSCAWLAERFPKVRFAPDAIYIRDG